MKASNQDGFTFLELIIVIGLIGIITAFVFGTHKHTVSINKLILEAEQVSLKLLRVINLARNSNSSMALICTPDDLYVDIYRNQRSNQLNPNGNIGIGVTGSLLSKTATDKIFSKSIVQSILLQCPLGNYYVTSDGNLLGDGGNPFELIFKTKNINLSSKLTVSALGYPRIYAKDDQIKNQYTEVLK